MKLPPMVYKPVVPLGGEATIDEELAHFIRHLSNQIQMLAMRMEMLAIAREDHLEKRRTKRLSNNGEESRPNSRREK